MGSTSTGVCIFLLNQTGVCVPTRPDTKRLTTDDLLAALNTQLSHGVKIFRGERHQVNFFTAADQIDTSEQRSVSVVEHGSDIFSLWITSPLLELQLMRKQRPFNILANWSRLLEKYTTANREAIDNDEPVLSYQRNVFCSKETESECDDPNILELLYEEAKLNILDGRYPCDEYEHFAATQAFIEHGPYEPKLHTPEYFKLHDYEYLPLHYRTRSSDRTSSQSSRSSQWFSPSRRGQRSLYSKIVEHYKAIVHQTPRLQLIKWYVDKCREMDFYGAAYFTGQIERVTRGVGLLVNHYDKKVWVAINHYGVHVINQKNSVSLE